MFVRILNMSLLFIYQSKLLNLKVNFPNLWAGIDNVKDIDSTFFSVLMIIGENVFEGK